MTSTIKYTGDISDLRFTGRNGYFKTSGIEIMDLPHINALMLTPLTSKGAPARCDMHIPYSAIPEFIKELQVRTAPTPDERRKWLETHHEMVSLINYKIDAVGDDNTVSALYYFGGTQSVVGLGIQLTDEFEEKYKGMDWDEQSAPDYYETVAAFFEEETKKL